MAVGAAILVIGSGGGKSNQQLAAERAAKRQREQAQQQRRETQAIEGAIKSFFAALADRDGQKACSLLSKSLVQSAGAGTSDCTKSVKAVAAKAVPDAKRSAARNIGVTGIELRGNTATASAVGTGQRQVTLVKEDGVWKLSRL